MSFYSVNGIEYLGIMDLILAPIILAIIIFICSIISKYYLIKYPEYQYFLKAIIFKLLMSVLFVVMYLILYQGGDSSAYYYISSVFIEVLHQQGLENFLKVWLGGFTKENYSVFTITTRWPPYWGKEVEYFFTKLIIPIVLISWKRYLIASIFYCVITFIGIWRMYQIFFYYYPHLKKQLAFAILFFPSFSFWSSGLLKDSLIICSIGWFLWGIFKIFIKKEAIISSIIYIIISLFIILKIKPYVFWALIPSSLLWLLYNSYKRIKSKSLKIPLIIISLFITYFITKYIFDNFKYELGDYSINRVLYKAAGTQQDLLREVQYGSNYFNIGIFDPNIKSIVNKIPEALFAGLFRPLIWEARNPMMLVSALENLFLLIFTFYLVYRLGIINFVSIIINNSILLFSFVFVLIFNTAVGLSVPNFGALARYKVLSIPFFVSLLFVLYSHISTQYYNKR